MKDTSLLAYAEIQPKLNPQCKKVLEKIRQYPDSTAFEIADKMGYTDPNHVRPRITDLADQELIFISGKRKCKVSPSHSVAHTWRAAKQ